MERRSSSWIACVAVVLATGCGAGRATTAPDAESARTVAAPPAAEASVARPPIAERSRADEPTAQEPTAQEPTAQEPIAQARVAPAPQLPRVAEMQADLEAPAPISSEVCPVGIPGLQIVPADVPGGAALVFRADPDHVRAIRERMARFAELQRENQRAHAGETLEEPAMFGDEDAMIHHARVTAVPTDTGVRLIARASRSSDVRALREEIRESAEALGRGACPLAFAIVG